MRLTLEHWADVTVPEESAVPTRYGNQATQRVLRLLKEFIGGEDTRGVSELSRAMGMNKNMVHRALTTLVEGGYLVRDQGGDRYQLGYRLLNFSIDERATDIRELARPALEQLHAVTSESVFLSIIVGSNRVNVDWIEGQGRRVSLGQRGRSVPLHTTKMSRMLLAHLPDAVISAYLAAAGPLDQFDAVYPTAQPTTIKSINADIEAMRGADHSAYRNPKQFDAAYAMFPIPGAGGRLHGIITIGGPAERFDPDDVVKRDAVLQIIRQLRQRCALLRPVPVVVAGHVLS